MILHKINRLTAAMQTAMMFVAALVVLFIFAACVTLSAGLQILKIVLVGKDRTEARHGR